MLIDTHIEEIEQVSANVRAAAGPNATALDRRVRSCIRHGPGGSAIERMSYVEMPDTIESSCIGAASCGRAIKSYRGASGVARHRCRVSDVFQPERGTNIDNIVPGAAMIIAGSYDHRAIGVSYGKINPTIAIDAYSGIAASGNRVDAIIANMPNIPANAIVFRDNDSTFATAIVVRQIDRPILG